MLAFKSLVITIPLCVCTSVYGIEASFLAIQNTQSPTQSDLYLVDVIEGALPKQAEAVIRDDE